MFTLIVENQYGEQMELTHNDSYAIKSVDGFDPPDAIINTSRNAGQDGSIYNSSYADERVIVITLAINSPAEINRINLYKYFKSKFPVKLIHRNGSRDVWIEGYVQSIQVAYFDKKETAQITVRCPRPYLNSESTIYERMYNLYSLFTFPFSIAEEGIPFSSLERANRKVIVNDGDIEVGFVVKITAKGSVTNPGILDSVKNQMIRITDTLSSGDQVIFDTRSGHKGVWKMVDGVKTNIINKLTNTSKWLTLAPGENTFLPLALSGSQYIDATFEIVYQYEGV